MGFGDETNGLSDKSSLDRLTHIDNILEEYLGEILDTLRGKEFIAPVLRVEDIIQTKPMRIESPSIESTTLKANAIGPKIFHLMKGGRLYSISFYSNKSTIRGFLSVDGEELDFVLTDLDDIEFDFPMAQDWWTPRYDETNDVYAVALTPSDPIPFMDEIFLSLENTGSSDAIISRLRMTRRVVI